MVPNDFVTFPSFPRGREGEQELKRLSGAVSSSIWYDWGNDHD